MSGYRLEKHGHFIDRSTFHSFTFDSQRYSGFAGDTLASALLSNGVKLFGRSFKYHRPRGVMTAGAEEMNALISLNSDNRTEPNTNATMVELYGGLCAYTQNNWPSVYLDLMSATGLFSPLLSAGFYYKTFIGTGQRTWHFFEPLIRKSAGMGRGTHLADPDRYDKVYKFCDVLVVGGGPAGLMAAEAASNSGARVLIADENPNFGGSVYEEPGEINGSSAADWADGLITGLKDKPNVEIVPRMTIFGYFDDNVLGGVERKADHLSSVPKGVPRQRLWTIHAKKVIVATGALERPIVFAGNDLPGVMLANSAHRYATRFGVAVGKNVAVFTNNDSGYHSALGMAKLGVNVGHIIDVRAVGPENTDLENKASGSGITVVKGAVVEKAAGWQSVSKIKVTDYDSSTNSLKNYTQKLECDLLAVSGGWSPTVHLCSQAGTPPVYDQKLNGFLPGEPTQDWIAAGAVSGQMDIESVISSGFEAGQTVSQQLGSKKSNTPLPSTSDTAEMSYPTPILEVPSSKNKGKKFVDLQHDVTAKDVRLAQREGYESVEHLKRYTTLGMAGDQGKTSNINGLAIMADARGIPIEEVGTTRFRPPYTPVTLGTLAGREQDIHLRPMRRTPLHVWHEKAGAEMTPAGAWMRPRIYGKPGETIEQAYIREAKTVRESVGLVDVSTLGKIDVQGPDAAEFINRVYSNGFLKLPVNKARYGLMLREDGFVFDDGTTWRLSENQFLMTTTTAHAATVLAHLEFLLATVWIDLKVQVSSVTDQWAAMAISGPKSRDVLTKVVTELDLGNDSFPFMAVGRGKIGTVDALVARLSFSGELAYEVFCGWFEGRYVWEALMKAGEEFNIIPYGLESMGTLRIEKGHVASPELDGRTTANDLGLGGMVSTKKNFVGSAMTNREGLTDEDRLVLVGLKSLDNGSILAGSHLVEVDSQESIGHVTSVTYSPACKCYIALALLKKGRERHGANLDAAYPLQDRKTRVEVVDSCFYDKEGKNLHV